MRTRLALLAAAATLSLAVAGCRAAPDTAGSGGTQPHAGAAGHPVVVGLGDSVMSGFHCDCAGIVSRYAALEQVAGRPRITPVNLGSNGATTTSLIADLRQTSVRQQVHDARVVLVIIGANDLYPQLARWKTSGCAESCYGPAVAAMGGRLGQVLATIRSVRGSAKGAVLVIDYWNIFRDGAAARAEGGQPLIDWSRQVSRRANQAICARSATYGDRCVDVYGPILAHGKDPTALLAEDGDHPNEKGVKVIVDQLVAATPRGTFG